MDDNRKQKRSSSRLNAEKIRQTMLRRSNLRLLIVTAVTCACYIYFVHLPGRTTRQSIQAELDGVELELAEANTLPFRLADTIQRRDAARKYIADWKRVSPSSSEVGSFGAVIAQIVAEAGAKTDHVSPESEIPFEAIGQTPITVEFDGYFHQVCEVLSELESRDECIWIDEVLMESNDEQSNPRLHCLMKLAVFTDKSEISD